MYFTDWDKNTDSTDFSGRWYYFNVQKLTASDITKKLRILILLAEFL